ncbi:MAG: serine/threonine-protein kinase [Myxococcota bacterium]
MKAVLGGGGLGTVYRVMDRESGRDVALKLLVPRYRGRAERESRLLAEGEMAGAVVHPQVVDVLGWGRVSDLGGCPYVAYEIVEGTSLNEILAWSGAFEPMRAVSLTLALARVVNACHDAGIVHRDVSVQNVFLGNGGPETLTLIDFSHASLLRSAAERATLVGEVPGTPWFMSPEQSRGEQACAGMDVFALGVVGYELLLGKNPYRDVQPDIFAQLQGREELRQPKIDCRVHPTVPGPVAELINQALALRAEDRVSLPHLIDGLRQAVEHDHGGSTADEDPTMLARKPAVVAEGARSAGDETLAQLVKDGVQMPSVKRVHESLRNANDDERVVLNKSQVLAALSVVSEPGEPEPAVEDEMPASQPDVRAEDSTSHGQGRVVTIVLVAMLALIGGAVGVFAFMPSALVAERGLSVAPAALGSIEPAERSSVGPKPEPEPEPEPKPEPEPEATPEYEPVPAGRSSSPPAGDGSRSHRRGAKKGGGRPRKDPPPTLPSVDSVPAEDTDACVRARADAKQAAKSSRSRDVLRLTRSKRCWTSSQGERDFLRTIAFYELGEFSACARAGSKSKHAEARTYAKLCASKQ